MFGSVLRGKGIEWNGIASQGRGREWGFGVVWCATADRITACSLAGT